MKVYDSQGRLKTIAAAASVEPTSGQFSALSNQVSVADAALSAAINVVSNSLSDLISVHNVLSNRVSANSATGGAGSVTSTEASAISAQAASAINVVSNAVSNEISNRVSADNVLSIAINVVSNAVSVVSVAAAAADLHASTASAAATSVDGRVTSVNAFISGISARSIGTSTHGLQSVVNALSNTISAASAAATSADAHANTASAAATSADAHANTVSVRVVSVSAELVSLVQIASAAATSADGHANAASAAATSVDARVNSVNTFISGISAISVGGVSTHGLQSVVNALSNRISAVVAGAASVTSAEASAISATAAANLSADHFISLQNVDTVSLVYGMPVYAFTSANTMKRADVSAWDSPTTNVVGLIADGVIAVSATGTIRIRGTMVFTSAQLRSVTGGSALTPGNNYYLTGPGQIGFSQPSGNVGVAKVGAALDTRTLLLQTGQAPADQTLSALISNGISAVSVGGVSTHGLQSVVNALSNRISAASAALSADHFISLQNVDTISLVYGMPVYAFTSANTMKRAFLANWTAAANHPLGLVADTVIAVSAVGRVQVRGVMAFTSAQLRSVTGGSSALAAGSPEYLTSDGQFGASQPGGAIGVAKIGTALDTRTLLLQVGGNPADQALSLNIVSIRDQVSALSAKVVSVSAQLVSLDNRVGSINTFISGISARSAGDVSTHGFQSVIDALSNRISAGGGGGSVTSNEVSAVSAQAASAINVVSARVVSVSAELASLVQIASAAATSADGHANTVSVDAAATSATLVSVQSTVSHLASIVSLVSTVSGGGTAVGLQGVINALSNRISAIPGGGSTNVVARVSTENVICAAALTDISGLTVSVSTGAVYRLEGMIMYSVSAATGMAFGLTFPAMTKAGGRFLGETSVPLTGASTISSYIGGPFDEGDSGSAVWSAAVGTTGTHMVQVDGVLAVATGGVVVPQARASVATNAVTIQAGSYMRVYKLS